MKKASLAYTLSAALTLVTTLSAADNYSPVENSLSSQNLSDNTLNKTASPSSDELAIQNYSKKDKDGNTALHWAIINNNLDLALALIEDAKVDLDTKNFKGQTPLHLISAKPFNLITEERQTISLVLETLIKKGANIHATNNKGDTPLHVVSSTGFSHNAHLLIKAGANVLQKGFCYKTPLEIAQNADNGAEIAAEMKRGIILNNPKSTNLPDSEQRKSLNKNQPMMPPLLWESRK